VAILVEARKREEPEQGSQTSAQKITTINPKEVQFYYLRDGILDKIFELCRGREVVPIYLSDEGPKYGSRPSEIQYRKDLEFLVKQGATSFHASVEKWKNALALRAGMRRDELDRNRLGWDLIIDIDSDRGLEFAKKTAILLVQALKMHGVKNISAKFSGRRGWHLGVRGEALPKEINFKMTASQYPELLQHITAYLKDHIKDRLREQFARIDSALSNADPFAVVHVEENWGSRHLFRMPYSFNEKTWLVSLPVALKDIASFDTSMAAPSKVKPSAGFLDKWQDEEARDLVLQAVDWHSKKSAKEEISKVEREYKRLKPGAAVPELFFPPCIQNILKGLKDGRKRGLFVLLNFLRSVGWEWPQIETRIKEWNAKNHDPIPEAYVAAQISYAKRKQQAILPPNCSNSMYYKDLGVWTKECEQMKNPVVWALRRWRSAQAQARSQGGHRGAGKRLK